MWSLLHIPPQHLYRHGSTLAFSKRFAPDQYRRPNYITRSDPDGQDWMYGRNLGILLATWRRGLEVVETEFQEITLRKARDCATLASTQFSTKSSPRQKKQDFPNSEPCWLRLSLQFPLSTKLSSVSRRGSCGWKLNLLGALILNYFVSRSNIQKDLSRRGGAGSSSRVPRLFQTRSPLVVLISSSHAARINYCFPR